MHRHIEMIEGQGGEKMDIFANINLVNKAIDATLTRKELISQNISNVDTPHYKMNNTFKKCEYYILMYI